MKGMKISMAVAASALLLSAPAMAFHDGGVAKCEGCHTMHNSLNNVALGGGTVLTSGPFLLQGGGQASDACLNCHEASTAGSYKVSTTAGATIDYTNTAAYPLQKTPGGDFSWLKVATGNYKNRRGHNVLATAHNFSQEDRNAYAPGGSYPKTNLQCSSCHDPHGKYRRLSDGTVVHAQIGTVVPPISEEGSYGAIAASGEAVGVYRILAGKDYLPKSQSTTAGLKFTYDPPVAVAPNSYNRSESATQTRVAYGQGMSEWCANCHAGMLNANGVVSSNNQPSTGTATDHVHPAGNNAKLGGGFTDIAGSTSTIADNYNAYKKSGDLSRTDGNSFDSLVPFELGTAGDTAGITALTALAKTDDTALTGPTNASNVMCLSCHRAHASGFDSMLRYEIAIPVITDSTGTNWNADTTGNAYKTAAYNGKSATIYGAEQRVLCNKCHAKD